MFLKQNEGKDQPKQSSHWKYAYQNIAGVEEVSEEDDESKRIDSYYRTVLVFISTPYMWLAHEQISFGWENLIFH